MAGLVAVLYGTAAYGVTLVALLYLIGFTGNLLLQSLSIPGPLVRFWQALLSMCC
ncbi:hypothetical protein ACVWXM_006374 [Bradyrhizobium sp. GM7.3]